MSPATALPRQAHRLAGGLGLLAVALCAAVAVATGSGVTLLPVVLLAAGIAGGEAFHIELPFRRGGVVSFSLCDTALTVGLLLLPGPEVVLAGALAMIGLQLVERLPAFKQAFNLAQSVAGFAAAALIVELVAPRPGPLSARVVVAAATGVLLLMVVNATAVGGMIAILGEPSWVQVVRRIVPTLSLLAVGNFCLGLLVVVLLDASPWALAALAVPLVLLHRASRAEVRAQVARERAQSHVAAEQRLAGASSTDDVARLLAEAATAILGVAAAVWHRGRWATPVPAGSGPCTLDPALAAAVESRGPGFGPAVAGACAAVGLDTGVLVVWDGEARLDAGAREWVERLGRSGRVHLARAAAATALAEEQATLRAVFDGTADGICVLDVHGAVRVWNPAMATLAGVPTDEALGRPADQVLGAGPWATHGVHDVVRPGERVWRVATSAVAGAHGPLRVAVVHDVSAERRVARMKDDMLAVVSHELRTPLTPIKATAQLLLRRWDRMAPAKRELLLTQVLGSADHLNRLVDDLLLVAQLSASSTATPRVSLGSVDLAEVVAGGVAALRLGQPEHELVLDVPKPLPTRSDPLRLRQVLDNLVANACKFSPAGSTVTVSLVERDGSAVLEVTDRGRGIPTADLERVFERFERVEDPLVMTTSGAGLGLYIVRALVTALGGTIGLRSRVGEGTTATVTLPLTPAAADGADTAAAA